MNKIGGAALLLLALTLPLSGSVPSSEASSGLTRPPDECGDPGRTCQAYAVCDTTVLEVLDGDTLPLGCVGLYRDGRILT